MANNLENLQEISIKILSDIPLTPEEEQEWDNWRMQDHIQRRLESLASDRVKRFSEIEVLPWKEFRKRYRKVYPFHWKKWSTAAAIILFCSFIGWYLLHNWYKQTPTAISEKAIILILPDQSAMELDVRKSFSSFDHGNFSICLDSGQICFRKRKNINADTGTYRVITPAGKTYRISLSDSSLVTLNNKSELTFSPMYDIRNRNVELKGEGFFDVRSNPDLAFQVRVRNTVHEVLGTSFLISGYENDPLITTTLYSGGLRISSGKTQMMLKDSQQVVIDPVKHFIRRVGLPDLGNASAWRGDYFSNRKTKILLTDLFRKIERWYDIKIIYDDNITNESLTIGRISRKMPADSVLNLLKGPGAFDFVKKEDGYHIRYSQQP
ncbi:FecR family protein [Pseudobacter ginsenosidimutans]|uniref:FecR family protein n=1 Tax=Pseudobacter ginsenosidimutans TaxID=661488 RepID=A0A4Q7MZM4_9BACT|nr:FecR family protein [Pseudobacter ginsenosidimutans]RZS74741.1 FecR family protein [Pseudobacter ginsenosidimutans]